MILGSSTFFSNLFQRTLYFLLQPKLLILITYFKALTISVFYIKFSLKKNPLLGTMTEKN
ncbi:MAG: hypothetical protein D6748_10125 [Calditrichaeota bacterium]|nr:MAG: hypothetical protein D6748_10125 [Calditrichota bacterium]